MKTVVTKLATQVSPEFIETLKRRYITLSNQLKAHNPRSMQYSLVAGSLEEVGEMLINLGVRPKEINTLDRKKCTGKVCYI